ncbi:MAG: enoyl-CoA hydratase/isomerase family protein [Sandaracinaceae bacterium]|nr:enoyl-CoA hydratase/isomerase family protein [Sandaracinaceae bacterium]
MRELVLRGRGPNTMTFESLRAFADDLEAHPDAPVLLYGEGNAFSAGLDLKALADGDPRAVTDEIERVVRLLFLHPAPTVAAVNGHAVAGGCLVAQACDLRLATDDPSIKIGMTGVALGITYPPVVMRLLRHRLPSHTIERVLLEAERHDPQSAAALGLVDEVVPDAIARGRERLAALAKHPRHAYAEAKLALRRGALDVDEAERARFEAAAAEAWDPSRFAPPRRD